MLLNKKILKTINVLGLVTLVTLLNNYGFINAQTQLKKIINFEKDISFISLNSKDDSLFVSFNKGDVPDGIYWFRGGKVIKEIKGATKGKFSPNGKFYSYILDNNLYINDENNNLVRKTPYKDTIFEEISWSYDSKFIFWCEHEEKSITINRLNILTGEKEKLFVSERLYFHPVTIKNNNFLYLLDNYATTDDNCNIVRLNIKTKSIEPVKIPDIKGLWLFSNFTISPNGKLAMFVDIHGGSMYVVDIDNKEIIDKIPTPIIIDPVSYSWKSDGSYVIFNQTPKDIYKYTIPKY